MKTFLFVAMLTFPNGESYVLDRNLTEDDCVTMWQESESWDSYYDGADIIDIPDGTVFSCIEESE